jgi:hemerythrin superfamily protein
MDVFKLLKKDHREVKTLFKKCAEASSSKAREKLFQQIAQELTMHTQLEEEIFYPRLRQEEKLEETIGEAYEEHHVAKLLIQELSEMSPDEERWDAKLTVLQEMVEHHVQDEEKELFPKAERALGKDEAKTLGKQVEAAKSDLLKGQRKAKRAARQNSAGERADIRA